MLLGRSPSIDVPRFNPPPINFPDFRSPIASGSRQSPGADAKEEDLDAKRKTRCQALLGMADNYHRTRNQEKEKEYLQKVVDLCDDLEEGKGAQERLKNMGGEK